MKQRNLYKNRLRQNSAHPPATKVATVKFFDASRGFGFLIPADGSPDIFFHCSALADRAREPAEGDAVRFVCGRRNGKPAALAVQVL